MTQQDLAGLAGVGLAFLYELEHGKPTLRLDKVLAVLDVLGLVMRLEPGAGGLAIAPELLPPPNSPAGRRRRLKDAS